jgi:electron transport complex protein RnfB
MDTVFSIIVMLTATGCLFGFLIAIASKYCLVPVDPLVKEVDEALPKGQCGACGYAGCIGYAEAVVKNPEVPVNLCLPGKAETADRLAKLTGKNSKPVDRKVAHVRCMGTIDKAQRTYTYKGIYDCVSANLLQRGNKACKYGCLGFGTCIQACRFGALSMGEGGVPLVNSDKCVGCGKCLNVCPKNIIEITTANVLALVYCMSRDKGNISKNFCAVSCIGCGKCLKACTYGAITIENNLAVINSQICISQCADPYCIDACPTKALQAAVY